MTIALKIGDKDSQVQGFIYLDAVTSYTKDSGEGLELPSQSIRALTYQTTLSLIILNS